jgi:hypothetical protein
MVQEPPWGGVGGKSDRPRLKRDLRHRRVRAWPHVAGRGLDLGNAAREQPYQCVRRGLPGRIGGGSHAHADQEPAVAHRASCRISARPAEALGADLVALHQRAARERPVLALVDLRLVAAAQLDRVEAQRVGQLVDRGFEREDAARLAGPAHERRGADIERQQPVAGAEVRARVHEPRGAGQGLDELLIAAGLAGPLMDQAGELAVGRRAEGDPLHGVRAVTGREEHLLAREDELDRALGL